MKCELEQHFRICEQPISASKETLPCYTRNSAIKATVIAPTGSTSTVREEGEEGGQMPHRDGSRREEEDTTVIDNGPCQGSTSLLVTQAIEERSLFRSSAWRLPDRGVFMRQVINHQMFV